jgi:uncharacterized membrane protein
LIRDTTDGVLASSLPLVGFVFSLQLAAFNSVSPLASIFLLLRQKKDTKEKATPGTLECPQ